MLKSICLLTLGWLWTWSGLHAYVQLLRISETVLVSRGTRMHHRLGRLFNSDRDRGNPSLMVMHDI